MAGIGDQLQVTGLEFLTANSFKTVRDLRLLAHFVSRRLVSGRFGVILTMVTSEIQIFSYIEIHDKISSKSEKG